ncbi:MAG: substrate-binding domain-containing protein [Bulleidia sp.]|nr:substrate-binding domain-containing protein [Bulleidia sp.]
MNIRKLISILAVTALWGCSASTGTAAVQGLDALGEIHAVTREADSGTRASFDDLIGITAESETLTVVNETDEVLDAVMNDPKAIGYLSRQAVDDTVKILNVDAKSVDDKTYPLTRSLYIVYKGELNDLEQEFLTYCTGKGQDIVSESYETVGSASTFLSLKPKGSIKIGGSSSTAPLIQELADAYEKFNPNADITVTTTDSTDGINGALEGTYDLGMSSRVPKSYEKQLLTFTAIARDRIAVIVEKDNPLTEISAEQLKAVYTGSAVNWQDLNSMN